MGVLYSKNIRRMSLFGQTIENALKREMDDQKVHYKPESLDALVEKTHFSRYELKYLYQCFKQEFVIQLSLFTKGTLAQRLDWLFDLYDCNGRGYLTEDDHLTVCRAMYALVGVHYYKEKHIPVVVRRHIKHQFTVDAINSSIKMSLLNETVAHGWIRGRKETRDTYGGEVGLCQKGVMNS
ncbi:hypothetical protein ANCCEY_12614 [Ancylostoma ceylanicum]|uniref:EF-hand domain-containing protein n=1 Tax=Ancylostoma ceylanicum TaxID=53326 RepID=A0A0D6LAS0_9BILA|nr:hypothetical protein ANCCEY_12614 [Ancylostoma ceylanicum]